jgi:1-deoxy-D-xylulose-5-phosphate reductoisomerase
MGEMKNICILGSTGSIGRNSLEVMAAFPNRFRVQYLSANTNTHTLEEQIKQFNPKAVAVLDNHSANKLKKSLNGATKIYTGEEGLLELVSQKDVDVVINSLVGFAGLRPTIEAIKHRKTVALANKETLVAGGEIIATLLKQYKISLIPIDSEHSAILQCLVGENPKNIERLILTASGGPFLHMNKKNFKHVTVDAALKHPNWKMGNKITIDSATLMNKGLEVIEAHWLFNLPPKSIDVLIHPQSIIHSMVEFVDGSVKAQLGVPDMKIPIHYALTYPDRAISDFRRVDFVQLRELTFSKPDLKKFECLQLAYDALSVGGTAPAILNAANEIAVELFLHGKITFNQIPHLIRKAMDMIPAKASPNMNDIIDADIAARVFTKNHDRKSK